MDIVTIQVWIVTVLQDQKAIVFFLLLGLGYLVGNIRIGSFSIGSVSGVLFVGLLFGYFGFKMTTAAQMSGFALFIFSVRYQAGPGFVAVLKQDGLKYFMLSVVVTSTGLLIAAAWASLLSLPPGMSAGLLAGGLTSSPTLAAAQDAVNNNAFEPIKGWTKDQIIDNIAMGYTVTYVFGLVGLLSLIKILPKLLNIDLLKEVELFEKSQKENITLPEDVMLRTYRITNAEVNTMRLEELRSRYWDKESVVKIKCGEAFLPLDERGIKAGDIIEILGPRRYFTEKISQIAKEISPRWKSLELQETKQIIVQHSPIVGLVLSEVAIGRKYGLFLMEIRR